MSPSPHDQHHSNPRADVVIAGAGLIGLSLALELQQRGAQVIVVERGHAMQQASIAAAGMLAVKDPHNPPALLPLSQRSIALYPAFLDRIAALSGVAVPFQTEMTFQHLADGTIQQIPERSLDPRQLSAALLAAVRTTHIQLIEHTTITLVKESAHGLHLLTDCGTELDASRLVQAGGAWTPRSVTPRKGQMLRVRLPSPLVEVHRSEHIYIVPRTSGLQAGTALLGATVEDAGFDTSVRQEDLAHLRALAAKLLPSLATESMAPAVESWAGLRPATPDSLPLLGPLHGDRQWIASGHFRNGILLAPGTAEIIANLLEGRQRGIDISAFASDRFGPLKD